MIEHLPECWAKHESDPPAWCICDELRACEERVRSNPDWRSHILLDELERCIALARKEWEVQVRPGVVSIADYRSVCKWAYIKGLNAAQEAVADINGKWVFGPRIYKHEAIHAIRLLRKGSETPPPLPPSVGVPEKRWT